MNRGEINFKIGKYLKMGESYVNVARAVLDAVPADSTMDVALVSSEHRYLWENQTKAEITAKLQAFAEICDALPQDVKDTFIRLYEEGDY